MIYTDGIHLIGDTLEELHSFARSIGLKREWFQDHRHPHYDLTTSRMATKAERVGAKKITVQEIIWIGRHNDMLEFICLALSNVRFSATTEYVLQDLIEKKLKRYSLPYQREVKIGRTERIDFLIGTIGIEVKIAGSVSTVIRQLQRYAKSKRIDNLILITTKASHEQQIPDRISGMSIKKISLWQNRL